GPASGPRGGSLALPPPPGWRDLAGRCWHARPDRGSPELRRPPGRGPGGPLHRWRDRSGHVPGGRVGAVGAGGVVLHRRGVARPGRARRAVAVEGSRVVVM